VFTPVQYAPSVFHEPSSSSPPSCRQSYEPCIRSAATRREDAVHPILHHYPHPEQPRSELRVGHFSPLVQSQTYLVTKAALVGLRNNFWEETYEDVHAISANPSTKRRAGFGAVECECVRGSIVCCHCPWRCAGCCCDDSVCEFDGAVYREHHGHERHSRARLRRDAGIL
jgi:hypothetical protein